jgi:ketopantoate hydroxymethyltransferase
MKANGENLYAYCHDYNGKIVDSDWLFLLDSASNVMAGHETTLRTLDQMIYHLFCC